MGSKSGARPPRPATAQELVQLCAAAAFRKKGMDLVALEVTEVSGYADYFLLVSGRSTRQTVAIAESLRRVLKKAGVKPMSMDGLKEGRWALLDYGDVVVHVFHEPVREFYDLESLWGDAPRLDLDESLLESLLPPDQAPEYGMGEDRL